MLPVIIGVAAAAAATKALYDWMQTESKPTEFAPLRPELTIFERNLRRLGIALDHQPHPAIAVIGQPGAGKSSLLVALTGGELIPRPSVGAETDATSWALRRCRNYFHTYRGLAFVDCPGYDTSKHPVEQFVREFPFSKFRGLLLVLDGKIHAADVEVTAKLISCSQNICVVRVAKSHIEDLDCAVDDTRRNLKLSPAVPVFIVDNRRLLGHEPLRNWIARAANL